MKAKTLTKLLVPLIVLSGAIALSALILMVLWNAFLVPVIGITALTFWLAVKGWAFIYFITAVILGVKQLVEFLMLNITMHVARKQAMKTVDAQEELMKHFSMFGGQDEKS